MTQIELFDALNNKEKVQAIAKDVRMKILDGEINPLDAAVVMKAMDEFVKHLRSNELVQDAIIEEVEKYGKVAEHNGATIQIKEVGTTYDFSVCNDPQLDILRTHAEDINAQIKQREAFLKCINGTETIVNSETGEVYTINQPVKKSKTGYSITL